MRTQEYTGNEIQDLKSILDKHQYTTGRTLEEYEYKEIDSSFTTYLLDQIHEDIKSEALKDIDHITETSESVKSILYSEEMQRTVWEYGTTEIHTEEYKQQAGESLEDAIYRTWENLDDASEHIYIYRLCNLCSRSKKETTRRVGILRTFRRAGRMPKVLRKEQTRISV